MSEKPILFSAPMVRAILEGRKTMTRRVIKPAPEWVIIGPEDKPEMTTIGGRYGAVWYVAVQTNDDGDVDFAGLFVPCPYGQPGDRLWVRETWGVGCRPDPHEGWVDGIEYRADQAYIDEIEALPLYPVEPPDGVEIDDYVSKGWRPSIHMPRWASRITLEITAIRVERVQDISEDDALAEGVTRELRAQLGYASEVSEETFNFTQARDTFRILWGSINAKRGHGWDANPWVWVVEFKRATP